MLNLQRSVKTIVYAITKRWMVIPFSYSYLFHQVSLSNLLRLHYAALCCCQMQRTVGHFLRYCLKHFLSTPPILSRALSFSLPLFLNTSQPAGAKCMHLAEDVFLDLLIYMGVKLLWCMRLQCVGMRRHLRHAGVQSSSARSRGRAREQAGSGGSAEIGQ